VGAKCATTIDHDASSPSTPNGLEGFCERGGAVVGRSGITAAPEEPESAMKASHGGMAAELRQAPAAVARQAQSLAAPLTTLVERLIRRPPDVVVTCARGSSAHAATFAKHLIERYLGIPVAAAAPNIETIYRRRLRLKHQFFLAISQSGSSDDLIEVTTAARAAGALTAGLVNDLESPLASACEIVLPMAAGAELSVAATKTFVASLAAMLRLTATWLHNDMMHLACERLPARLAAAAELDWRAALHPLAHASSLVAIGRGPTLAIAREAALKLKETCALHAEAFSGAEFRHGPIALVSATYPILILVPSDEAAPDLSALAEDLRREGACVLVAEPGEETPGRLPALAPDQADADAICLMQSFYAFLVNLGARRGTDVDHPRHLHKVTRTR
jgi:glutamine---fructose-6-phosphate transaminase (isomerizing)